MRKVLYSHSHSTMCPDDQCCRCLRSDVRLVGFAASSAGSRRLFWRSMMIFHGLFLACLHFFNSAEGSNSDHYAVVRTGPSDARHAVCKRQGSDSVGLAEEIVKYHDSNVTSFTMQCRDGLEFVPRSVMYTPSPLVCSDNSTNIDDCELVSLISFGISPTVSTLSTTTQQEVTWTLPPDGFPRAPQKFKVGCASPHDLAGCMVTVTVRQAVSTVKENFVDCTYERKRTVTDRVAVTTAKNYFAITCGREATFYPTSGYCTSEKLESCTPKKWTDLIPHFSDSWWTKAEDGRALSIPEEHIPLHGKKLYVGCKLANQTGDSDKPESYYCVVPVRVGGAAKRRWELLAWYINTLISLPVALSAAGSLDL